MVKYLGFDATDLRALGAMAAGAFLIIPTAAYLLGGVQFGPRDWAPGLDLQRLVDAGPVAAAHIAAAIAALVMGVLVLGTRKGVKGHRLGWAAGFSLAVDPRHQPCIRSPRVVGARQHLASHSLPARSSDYFHRRQS